MKFYTKFLHYCPAWISLLVFFLISVIWFGIGKRLRNQSVWRRVNIALLAASLLLIAWCTLLSRVRIRVDGNRVIWIPFQKETLRIPILWTWRAAIDNVLLFIPLGLATTQLHGQKKKYLFIGVAVSLIVELTQYYFHLGVFETEDVICNTCGFLIPWIVNFEKFVKIRKQRNLKT